MKKILFSILIIAVVAAIAAGGTFAYFTATDSAPIATFATGEADLTLSNSSGEALAALDLQNMDPGVWYQYDIYVSNLGDYDMLYHIKMNDITNVAFGNQIHFQIYSHQGTPGYVYDGSLTGYNGSGGDQEYLLAKASGAHHYTLYVSVYSSVPNDFQNASTNATLAVTGQQMLHSETSVIGSKP